VSFVALLITLVGVICMAAEIQLLVCDWACIVNRAVPNIGLQRASACGLAAELGSLGGA